MATRGHLGGVSRATSDAVLLLDAAGMSVILIETVGVGQDEVDIVRAADVSVVVLVPGAGDEVQALKAGIMEIADVFVINKADRDGADQMVQTIRAALALGATPTGAEVTVTRTIATTGEGVSELWRMVEMREAGAGALRAQRQRVREEARLRDLVAGRFRVSLERAIPSDELDRLISGLVDRTSDPYALADMLFERACGSRTS
jgi:LAO/AO transport system kinase